MWRTNRIVGSEMTRGVKVAVEWVNRRGIVASKEGKDLDRKEINWMRVPHWNVETW
ncbi:hypothetical protein BGW80DRAFT_1307373 [Lactifluus volemus]|nr:hypothetical protein BGW80DRAFT_1307373 [Lactifluus volemus]